MKISLYQIASILCLVATAGLTPVLAQDNVTSDIEITDSEKERYERDKLIFSPGGEGETRYFAPRTQPTGSSSGTPKDSVSITAKAATNPVLPAGVRKEIPGKHPTKAVPPTQDDDAILSFNFLYYIIKKYKLQEIIE